METVLWNQGKKYFGRSLSLKFLSASVWKEQVTGFIQDVAAEGFSEHGLSCVQGGYLYVHHTRMHFNRKAMFQAKF